MSRCFPFPPPGYVLGDEVTMIESIKGVELEKAKKEERRKEKKREKKEKKERKEKKRKEREGGNGEHSHKRRRKEEGGKDGQNLKVGDFQKLKGKVNECLDKSSLTIERELLQSTSQNSCDSTLNSNEKPKENEKEKRKQAVDGRHNNSNDSESIIRIRLPIRRQKDPEVMLMTNKDQPKPRELKLDSSQPATREQPVTQRPGLVTNKDQQKPREIKLDSSSSQLATTREQPFKQHPCSTSAPEHSSKPHEEKRKHRTSTAKLGKEKMLSSLSSTPEPYQPSRLCNICPPSLAAQFLNVVENWVPTTIETRVELANPEDEECWWFTKKPSSHKKFDSERCKQLNINNEIKQVTAWPCARLLPEAEIYALPYTVPF